jgi:hypothetical protein
MERAPLVSACRIQRDQSYVAITGNSHNLATLEGQLAQNSPATLALRCRT